MSYQQTAGGILANTQCLDQENYLSIEKWYEKKGPWIMLIKVDGEHRDISAITPRKCVHRANELYENRWTEISLDRQQEFFEKVTAL